jgi:hypothetical protein
MLRRAVLCLAIAAAPAWAEGDAITPFSTTAPGTELPAGWRPMMLPRKTPVELAIVRDDGQSVLRSRAESAFGTAAYEMRVDIGATPLLTWRWKIDHVIAGTNTSTKAGEDYAARVYVTFDLPASTLSLADRAKLKIAGAIYAMEMPTASICYVWDNRLPVGSLRASPYTDRMRTIVLRSGNEEAGKWVTEARDLDADFQAAFGAEHRGTTPAVTGIAVGNDTDQTHGVVTAWFGDFAWQARP